MQNFAREIIDKIRDKNVCKVGKWSGAHLEFEFRKSLFGDNPEFLQVTTSTAIVLLFSYKVSRTLFSNFDNGE